jgi:hypothetical protein
MNQRRMILGVIAVAVASAAIWAWRESSQRGDGAIASAQAPSRIQDAFHQPSSAPAGAREPVPPVGSSQQQTAGAPTQPAAAPEANQNTASAQLEPANVDMPEPAERKFAHGGRADESGPN